MHIIKKIFAGKFPKLETLTSLSKLKTAGETAGETASWWRRVNQEGEREKEKGKEGGTEREGRRESLVVARILRESRANIIRATSTGYNSLISRIKCLTGKPTPPRVLSPAASNPIGLNETFTYHRSCKPQSGSLCAIGNRGFARGSVSAGAAPADTKFFSRAGWKKEGPR